VCEGRAAYRVPSVKDLRLLRLDGCKTQCSSNPPVLRQIRLY
jgi:hypothetical protein